MSLSPRSVASLAAAAVLTAGGLIATAPESAAAQTRVVCKADVLTVRSQPTSRSRAVDYLRGGQWVSVTPVRGTAFSQIARGRYVGNAFLCAPSSGASARSLAASPAVRGNGLMRQPTTTSGSRTGSFGWRIHPVTHRRDYHRGLDIGSRAGMPVYAAASGRVLITTRTPVNGKYVRIEHGNLGGYRNVGSYYLHLSRWTVRPGQYVKAGQIIGYTGSTGRSTGPHLHFGVRVGQTMVNPEIFIGSRASLRNF